MLRYIRSPSISDNTSVYDGWMILYFYWLLLFLLLPVDNHLYYMALTESGSIDVVF